MTTAMAAEKEDDVLTEEELKRKFTVEERDALFEAVMDMSMAGNSKEATRMLRRMPIHPRWAKIIADVMGRNFLLENFNITHADEVYGEGWLDGK